MHFCEKASKCTINVRGYKDPASGIFGFAKGGFPQGESRFLHTAKSLRGTVKNLVLFGVFEYLFAKRLQKVIIND